MTPVLRKLHEAIGGICYVTSQTVAATSRAAAHPTEMDGYWPDRALEQIAVHREQLDKLEAEVRGLVVLSARAA